MNEAYIGRGDSLIERHAIGPYVIIEFWSRRADNVPDKRRERLFGIIIDGDRQHTCFASLDEALAGCIAAKHEGLNHRADHYFINMIGAERAPDLEEMANVERAS